MNQRGLTPNWMQEIFKNAQKWTKHQTPYSTKSLNFKKCEFSIAYEMHLNIIIFKIRGLIQHLWVRPLWFWALHFRKLNYELLKLVFADCSFNAFSQEKKVCLQPL